MGKKYLDTKGGTLESSILGVWKQAAVVTETNKNDKSDDGEGLDAVQPKAVKKKFADRKDKDIDNDGDTDSSDEYLHKRRKAVSKAIATEGRQLKDKKKEMMVSLKGNVKVIDKSDWPVYKKKGYIQAEQYEVDEQLAKIKGNTPADEGRRGAVEDDIERAEKKGDNKLVRKLKEDEIYEYITKEGTRRKVADGDGRRMSEGGMKRGKDLKTFKPKPKDKKEEVEAADEYTEAAYFKVQSMRAALRKVWNVEEDWTKKGPDAYDKKKKEAHVPGHDEDDEKVKGKNAKTDTGKKAAKVDIKPEITEKKKKSIKSGYNY
jgi:hypothetical protein